MGNSAPIKKVLFIPSWYPNVNNLSLGTFFLEQIRLFSDIFEIKVLCGTQKIDISRIRKIHNSLCFLIYGAIKSSAKINYFIEPPEVVGFEYECGLNILRKLNYKISVKAYFLTIKELSSKWNFTLIHAHDTVLGGISAYYFKKKFNIPYLITEHNYLQFKFPSYLKRDFISAIESSRKILLVSEYQLRNLLMYGINCKYDVVGNYVDDLIFAPNKIFKEPKVFNILFIGRNAHHKDLDTLWKVIKEFNNIYKSDDYCFTIIGNSFEQADSESDLIFDLKSKGRVNIKTFVGRNEIISYFDETDVYLSTSIAETFGVGICEAMMCGIPVVSTNNGGVDEMYIQGVNGIKSKIGDYKALAAALYKIKTKEIIFEPLEIRKSVLKKFGREAFKGKMLEIYNAVNE